MNQTRKDRSDQTAKRCTLRQRFDTRYVDLDGETIGYVVFMGHGAWQAARGSTYVGPRKSTLDDAVATLCREVAS